MVERVTERTDGVTTERVVETETAPSTTIVERRGGSGAGLLIGLAVLVLVVIGAIFLINQNSRENAKTDAITSVAKDVSGAAQDVGDAAKDVAKNVQ